MIIRRAEERDAQQIAEVHVKSWQQTYKGIVNQDFLANMQVEERYQMWKGILSVQNDSRPVFVVENNEGKIIGFASFGPERTKKFDQELYAIYLLDEYKRHRLGSRLFYKGVQLLCDKGCLSILVWVMEDNPSRKFYEKFNPVIIEEDIFEIKGDSYSEIAFYWKDINQLKSSLEAIEGVL